MYCKLFASLYQGTLRGRSNEILVFTNLLAHAGRDGTVDKHFRAIAEETGLSIDEVKAAILVLEAPDEESRSPEYDGARIVKMDGHRAWGWLIVNYAKYRAIRSEEDRAEQNRLAQQRWRNKNKPESAESKQDKPKEREEGDGEAEGKGGGDTQRWFPESLRDVAFASRWGEWEVHLSELSKPLGASARRGQLVECERNGRDTAMKAILFSISNNRNYIAWNWQSDTEKRTGKANGKTPRLTL